MSSKTSELLFALIRSSVFNIDIPEELTAEMKSSLRDIYREAKRQDLGHLLFDPLSHIGIISKDDEGYSGLEKEKLSAIFRSVKMERELTCIKAVLTEEKILHIPLKGAVIRALYPESYMRTSCDIDLLVRKEDLERVISLFQERLKYTTDGKMGYHDISLFSPSGVHIELHFSILENIEKLDRVLCRVFDFAAPTNEGAFTYALTNEFLLFHLAAHASYHFVKGGSGIKPVIDLYLLDKKIEYNRDVLLSLLREAEIEKFFISCERLSAVWFECEEHDELTKSMESFILEGGVYGTEESLAASIQAKQGGKFKTIFRLIFLPYKSLKVLYPALEKRRILMPIYQIRRWFRIIFKGRLGKAVKTIKANTAVTDEARKSTVKLFTELGL